VSRIVQRNDGQSGLAATGDGEVVIAGTRAAGFLGIFGRGQHRVFSVNETFVIPSGVTRARVRVIGAGGGTPGVSSSGNWISGAGGGGYAHGVFDVVPGASHAVVIGAAGAAGTSGSGAGTAGGTSSFGSLISATGGQPGVNVSSGTATGGAGGVGTGGDFQAKGGKGGDGTGSNVPGSGGAAGSQLGDGGTGAIANDTPGGGGVGGNQAGPCSAGSAFGPGGLHSDKRVGGPDVLGVFNTVEGTLVENPILATCRFPFDVFTGAASYTASSNAGARSGSGAGGPGGGGSFVPSSGGHGGGGGVCNSSSAHSGGSGGVGGGAGGAFGASKPGAPGGRGLVIVEW
jgi:hypothetical protein